ncbi:MAG: polyphosphate kinase 1 [Planctomycetota bacterium]
MAVELDRSIFNNRELSWLEFNDRVLHEAVDNRTPLLERVTFLGIFTSNLDEFFMKRVGGLDRQVATGVVSRSLDGQTAQQQLKAIRKRVIPMLDEQARVFDEEIKPQLADHDVHLLGWGDLNEEDREFTDDYFDRQVYPVLTPLAVDPGHPFPFISNLSQSLGLVLSQPGANERLFARLKVPELLPQWVRLPAKKNGGDQEIYRYARLRDIICQNLDKLFPNMEVLGVMPFRVTRNADIERDEEDAEDLLDMMAEELRARRFARVVRLEHGPNPNPWILQFLVEELGLSADAVYELPGELDYTDLGPIADLPIPGLKHKSWTPVAPAPLADDETDIFSLIRDEDFLVHPPYESFSASVERLITTAAEDPKVVAIKMTLYRTGDDSPFIETLIRAAESGKQVVCLVEVKARFDEHRNIKVAQELEKAGVHVVYGVVGLKTHTKTALVVRREADGLHAYAHIGTGNYHSGTARVYTDLGLFTDHPDFTDDVIELFNYLTGRSLKTDFRKLLVAPVNMKERFIQMIEREVVHHEAGRPSGVVAKMNSLEDKHVIAALSNASQAGVPIDLIVRGFCCLRPGVEGLSDNIRVVSVVGRFLEHSRLFHFRNGAEDPVDGEFFIGSADWMYRNLERRVEAITPIEDHALRRRCWQLLDLTLNDRRQSWDMQPDGSYVQREPRDEEEAEGVQAKLMRLAANRWQEDPPSQG